MSIMGKINICRCDFDDPVIRIPMYGYVENFLPEVWYHPNRISPFWRFYWGTTEGANLVFKENTVKLDRQIVVFVPPHTPFETKADSPFSQLYIHFEWFGMKLQSKPILLPVGEGKKLLESVHDWYETPRESFSLYMHALLFHYLIQLRQYLSQQSQRIDQRIQKALILLENEEKSFSLRETAKSVSMSYDHFRDTFKKQIGISPGEYKMMQRMNYARKLLQSSNLPIEEIANRSGFTNRFHFSKTFKQFFKQPPAIYRRLWNLNAETLFLSQNTELKNE